MNTIGCPQMRPARAAWRQIVAVCGRRTAANRCRLSLLLQEEHFT